MQHFQALLVAMDPLPVVPSGSVALVAGPAGQAGTVRHPLLRPPISA